MDVFLSGDWLILNYCDPIHCVKSFQIRISPNTGKYGPEKTPYLDTFQAVITSPFTHFS